MKLGVRIFFIIVGICLIIFSPKIAGYFTEKQEQEKIEVVFPISEYNLQITADERYEDVTAEGNFDLQLKKGDLYISIFAFDESWLKEGQTTKDIYQYQNEDILSLRTDVEVVKEETTEKTELGKITRTLFQGKRMGTKYSFDCYLVEFDDVDTFAWVVVTDTPANYEIIEEYVKNIVYSLEPITL